MAEKTCSDCDNYLAMTFRDETYSHCGECLSGSNKGYLVSEIEKICEDFADKQGGE